MKSRIKAYCARYDIEFSDLAKALEIHKSEFSRLISGKTHNSRYFDPLCEIIECSREWLLIGEGKPPEWFSEGVSYRSDIEKIYDPIEKQLNLLSKQINTIQARTERISAIETALSDIILTLHNFTHPAPSAPTPPAAPEPRSSTPFIEPPGERPKKVRIPALKPVHKP